jgi:hypothetical protein
MNIRIRRDILALADSPCAPWEAVDVGKTGTYTVLAVAVVVGLISLFFAFLDPSNLGAWATAVAMVCLVFAQIMRLRGLNRLDR